MKEENLVVALPSLLFSLLLRVTLVIYITSMVLFAFIQQKQIVVAISRVANVVIASVALVIIANTRTISKKTGLPYQGDNSVITTVLYSCLLQSYGISGDNEIGNSEITTATAAAKSNASTRTPR